MTTPKKVAIQEKAVLVTLNFSNGVSFTVTDKPVTQEVEEIHKTDKAGRYVKTLFRRDDLPTPDCPHRIFFFPLKSCFNLSVPILVLALVLITL